MEKRIAGSLLLLILAVLFMKAAVKTPVVRFDVHQVDHARTFLLTPVFVFDELVR